MRENMEYKSVQADVYRLRRTTCSNMPISAMKPRIPRILVYERGPNGSVKSQIHRVIQIMGVRGEVAYYKGEYRHIRRTKAGTPVIDFK